MRVHLRVPYVSVVGITIVMLGVTTTSQAQSEPKKPAQGSHDSMITGMTDAQFVPMMIKHHQDGIQMSQGEEQGGSAAEVKALAAKIRQSQERDIQEMKQHAPGGGASSGGHGHDKMMEQQSARMMKRLKSASGAALDHAFLEEMSKHHQMAIDMTEGAKLEKPELQQLAQKMLAEQRKELAELKKLMAGHTAPK